LDLKELELLGPGIHAHWYYRAKAAAVLRLLGPEPASRILDIGAGSGFFSRTLLERTTAAEAWCVDTSYPADSDDDESGKPVHYRRALASPPADLVLLMDVLEHVDDDGQLLGEAVAQTRQGGRVLITVPAFQWLWSPHDEFLGHRRRYTLDQLHEVVEQQGLQIERSAYFFALTLPLAVATRMVARYLPGNSGPRSQLRRHHPVVNRLLLALCQAELPWFAHNRVGGLSALCLARRP
jgi:SAM-dependent methyltransferase